MAPPQREGVLEILAVPTEVGKNCAFYYWGFYDAQRASMLAVWITVSRYGPQITWAELPPKRGKSVRCRCTGFVS
jgi:hypothetical protein